LAVNLEFSKSDVHYPSQPCLAGINQHEAFQQAWPGAQKLRGV
jgi:hypothetical protein